MKLEPEADDAVMRRLLARYRRLQHCLAGQAVFLAKVQASDWPAIRGRLELAGADWSAVGVDYPVDEYAVCATQKVPGLERARRIPRRRNQRQRWPHPVMALIVIKQYRSLPLVLSERWAALCG